jgi:hypothetical protein
MPSLRLRHTTMNDLPLELLSHVAAAVFWSAHNSSTRTLDPFVLDAQDGAELTTSASYCWPEPTMRRTLASLCRVNHACAEATRPWLWRVVSVRLPRDWIALLDQTLEEVEESADGSAGASETGLCATAMERGEMTPSSSASTGLRFADIPSMSIPLELLTPPASREPSPRRLRSKSRGPARWEVIRSLTHAMQSMMRRQEPAYFGGCSWLSSPHDILISMVDNS